MQNFSDFSALLREFIRVSSGGPRADMGVTPGFDDLALALFRWQFEHNDACRRFCNHRQISPDGLSDWRQIPAVPAATFKELEQTSVPERERTTVFYSSGTTSAERSRHFHSADSLKLYEASLLPWFEHHLLSDLDSLVEDQLLGAIDKMPMLFLTPDAAAAPNSSLVYMFAVIQRELASRDSVFAGRVGAGGTWALDIDRALFAIRKSMCANRPLVLLGTAFNFVHLLDHFAANNMRYRLARGSRVLETGGYKGQSREVPRPELHALITKHLGIPAEYIVTEYGMSELSSQAYNRVAGEPEGQAFHFPPWARAQVISPETGCEADEGEAGLIRVFDLANVSSVMALQTEDLAVRRGDGFELLGRAANVEPRGCSLMSPEGRGAV